LIHDKCLYKLGQLSYPAVMMNHILEQAIAKMGSQTALAKAIGKSQGHISKWLERKYVPAESVLAIESATGIPRQKIRPDLYPEETKTVSVDNKVKTLEAQSKPKSIMGLMKGLVTFPADFNPEEPFWELHKEWEEFEIGGMENKK
jgi:DNA-binding transcriptional regulator YdaS (Cro superfamily)